MAGSGYDIADHFDVEWLFGTLEDWARLAAGARRLAGETVMVREAPGG